jgi:myo-inositol-1(or 4)-monophosphatase
MSVAPGEIAALLELATELALEAGTLLADRQPHVRRVVDTKSSPTDMVTEVDRETEALIVGRILAARPTDGVLGEEGANRAGTSGVRWVIDPLDGTTNYVYGYPAYSVSIGVEADGETVVGVVYDAARGELFSASKGGGAFLNGKAISVSSQEQPGLALCATGFGYEPEIRRRQAAVCAWMTPRVRDIRRSGSAAIDLCSAACGRVDAYYEFGLNDWDRAAGILIVREAGGRAEVLESSFGQQLNLACGQALFEPLHRLVRDGVAQAG